MNNPTLIDWSTVESNLRKIQESFDYPSDSNALTHLLLEHLFPLSPEEISDSITDGPLDRGVDAIVILETMPYPEIHFFQVKHVEAFKKASNFFPANEIDKLQSFIADLLEKSIKSNTVNPILWERVKEIWDLFEEGVPRFVVHLAGNMDLPESSQLTRFQSSLERYRHFRLETHSLKRISDLLTEADRPKIDGSFKLVDKNYFERVDGNLRGLIATIPATELVSLIRDPSDESSVRKGVFDENIRVYLSARNRFNRRIIESALSENNSEFWYLNNGVTITCDSLQYTPGVRAPRVEMKNIQIINGGQTSHALFEAWQQRPEHVDEVLLLVRIYETKEREINLRIAESTNSQTPIKSRDLRANDEVQRKLESAFRAKGYFYERKLNQFRDQPREQRIDALRAAQAHVAYWTGMPSVAAKERGKLFGELYDSVFTDDLTADMLLTSLRILEPINLKKAQLQTAIRKQEDYQQELLFLIDGAYHLLYALGQVATIQGIEKADVSAVIEQLPVAIEIMEEAVRREREDPAFAHKRFFKSTRAKKYIDQAVKERAEHLRLRGQQA